MSNADILKREIRAAQAEGDYRRVDRLRTTLASMGEPLPADARHRITAGERIERAIADPTRQGR